MSDNAASTSLHIMKGDRTRVNDLRVKHNLGSQKDAVTKLLDLAEEAIAIRNTNNEDGDRAFHSHDGCVDLFNSMPAKMDAEIYPEAIVIDAMERALNHWSNGDVSAEEVIAGVEKYLIWNRRMMELEAFILRARKVSKLL